MVLTKTDRLITPKSSDRLVLTGRTGSGKTTFARKLLTRTARFVVLDPKHMFAMPGVEIVKGFDAKLDRQIIRDPPGTPNELAFWDEQIMDVWNEGDYILYIDEVTLVNPNTHLRPTLGRAIRTGRERGVGVHVATQRPRDIPNAIYTEADHFVIFDLAHPDDKKKIAGMTVPAVEEWQAKGEYDYIYYNIRTKKLTEIRVKKRKGT